MCSHECHCAHRASTHQLLRPRVILESPVNLMFVFGLWEVSGVPEENTDAGETCKLQKGPKSQECLPGGHISPEF